MHDNQPDLISTPVDAQGSAGISSREQVQALENVPENEVLQTSAHVAVPAHEQAQALIPEHARVRKLIDLDDGELENRRSLAQVELIYQQADIAKDPSTYRRWCKKNEWPGVVPLPVMKVDMGDGGSPLWLVHIGAIQERAFQLARSRDLLLDLNAGGSLLPNDAQPRLGVAVHEQADALMHADALPTDPTISDDPMPAHEQAEAGEPVRTQASDDGGALKEQFEARIADLKEALERERSDKSNWRDQVESWQEQAEALNKQLTNAQSNLELAMLKESRGDELNSGWQKLLSIFGLQKHGDGAGDVLVSRDAVRLTDSQLPDIESSRRVQ